VAEYARQRGFYGRYEDVAGDDWARDWPEAVDQLRAVLTDPEEHDRRRERARALDAQVHAYSDGGSTRRVFDVIRSRIAAPERDSDPGRSP
jgi:CDP-glycerol glycerophosphotransferase